MCIDYQISALAPNVIVYKVFKKQISSTGQVSYFSPIFHTGKPYKLHKTYDAINSNYGFCGFHTVDYAEVYQYLLHLDRVSGGSSSKLPLVICKCELSYMLVRGIQTIFNTRKLSIVLRNTYAGQRMMIMEEVKDTLPIEEIKKILLGQLYSIASRWELGQESPNVQKC